MRFTVTSIAWTEVSEELSPVANRLQDALNALLGDSDFGGGVAGLCIVVVATEEDPERLEKQRSKVFSFMQVAPWPETVKKKELFVKVIYSFHDLDGQGPESLLTIVSSGIAKALEARPRRLPKGFEYERLAAAVTGVMSAFTP